RISSGDSERRIAALASALGARELLTQIEGQRKGRSGKNMRTAASDGKRRAAMKEMPLNIGFVEVRGDGGRCRVKGGEGGVGALGEIRTPDPRNRNPMLYPAELRAPKFFERVGIPTPRPPCWLWLHRLRTNSSGRPTP